MTSSYVDAKISGHIATLSLSNPPTHTINAEGSAQLFEELEQLADAREVRVVILTGGSDDIFVRHYEVGELATSAERLVNEEVPEPRPVTNQPPRRRHGLAGAMRLLEGMNAITIAAINGMAMGGGLELTLACDFRLARAGEFNLGLPETGVGILPGGGGTQRLARLIGVGKALDLVLHGQIMRPEVALEYGIVSRVFANDLATYRQEVNEFASNLASRAPRALANSKRAIREGIEMSLGDGLRRESELFRELMATEDAALALRAAFEGKPRPEFKGK